MSDRDPLTQVYDALWTLLEKSETLRTACKIGNRIAYNHEDRDAIKDSRLTDDLPEMRVVPLTLAPHIQRTSNSSWLTKRFAIQVATGNLDIGHPVEGLFVIEFAVYRALSNWVGVLQQLKWKDKPFVHLARPTEASSPALLQDDSTIVRGWTTIWQCEIQMVFATADLQAQD